MVNQYGAEVLPTIFDNIYLTKEGYAFVQVSDTDTRFNARVGYFAIPESFSEKKRIPPVTVYLNGIDLYFDSEPTIVNSRTMVPMRKIFETLGAEVSWDESNRRVSAVRGEVTVELAVGQDIAYLNGNAIKLDAPAMIQDDRTLVPLRFVAEALDCDVSWDSVKRRVEIKETRE